MFNDKWHCHRNICMWGMNTREPEFRSSVQLLEPLTPRWDWNPSPDQNCLQISSCPVPYPLHLWISCHRKSFRKTLPDQRITKLSFSPASIFYYFTRSVLDPLRVLIIWVLPGLLLCLCGSVGLPIPQVPWEQSLVIAPVLVRCEPSLKVRQVNEHYSSELGK